MHLENMNEQSNQTHGPLKLGSYVKPEVVSVSSTPKVVDTMIISDIHLGADVSRSVELLQMLQSYSFKRLILNGDVFDNLNFKRLDTEAWDFLSYIRMISKPSRHVEVVWVAGNHDGVADMLSHLLGVQVLDEYKWSYNGVNYLAMHGHQFDKYVQRNVVMTEIATWAFNKLQKLSKTQDFSRWVKRKSKALLKISDKISDYALDYAKHAKVDVITCGHTHVAGVKEKDGIRYFNSGAWTDKPSQFITVDAKNGMMINNYY